MVSTVKLPILKKVTTDENGVETEVPPKTAQALLARQRERKAKSILLLAIPDEYQLRFHAIKDAKTLLLEVHGATVSNEDANQKLLRALPSLWNNVALIMRNKAEDTSNSNEPCSPQLDDEDLEQIDHDDLEEMDLKWQVSMLSMRVKRFYKKTERKLIFNGKEPVGYRSRDNTRRTVLVETYDALVVQDNALIIQDGLGYDWSYIAQDEPIEFALMAYTANSSGSNTKVNLEIVAYKLGLESVEAQLVVHQKNEVVYEEKIAVLEFEVKDKDKTGLGYRDQLNEKNLSNSGLFNSVFDSRSSDRDDNQTKDRFKKDNEYHAVPSSLTGNYIPPLADLSFAGLDDSVYRPTSNKTSASLSQVSDDEEDIFQSKDSQTTVKPSFKKIEFTKARNETVKSDKQAIKHRMVTQSPKRMPKESVLRKGLERIQVSTAKQNVNTATPKNRVNVSKIKINTFFPKSHSPIRRPFYKSTVLNTRVSKEKVNTVRVNGVNTAGKIAVSTVKGNGVTAVKASAGCVWRPKKTDLNNGSKDNSGSWILKRGNPQQALKYKGMFDSGCSRHMTGNKALLTDYQDIDGGFVAFGGSTRGGKITGIGKIRTNKINFEDVFFVKELKFNLFFVSQMCDKKNIILFTETECLVLSPDFKLIDESQVLLRVPRQNNMYSFDLKNVVPSGDLTCLFAKATIDESKLWHRRQGPSELKQE
ncbi:hypothetical protein Tco_0026656 [Tanacetum coccineum]